MREVKPGDLVFHFIDKTTIVGVSEVFKECDDCFLGVPGTEWQGKPSYLIRLVNYTKLNPPIDRSEFLDAENYRTEMLRIVGSNDSLFFTKDLKLRQGAYLTIAPLQLVKIWDEIYTQKTRKHLPLIDPNLFVALPSGVVVTTPQPQNAAYLLTWNSEKWAWSDLPSAAKGVCEGVQPKSENNGARWSVSNHGIQPGDRVFIVRLGLEPKGIIGSGKATSPVFEAPHFGGEPDKTGHYVEIEWDALIDPSVESPLSIADLRQNVSPDYNWTPQASGLRIPDDVRVELEASWAKHRKTRDAYAESIDVKVEPFTTADALKGLFTTPDALDAILARLKRKKALILQGPPGVGKTFIARRLAFALMGERDERRVAMVQFHPSYGYEDFVQGYRPTRTGLERRDGVCHQFACLARNEPDRDWFFIIDEINRGNLAKIFGELLMLIEADKRGPDHAIPLTYSDGPEETFQLPANLHFIGTMNTADRSLAMVDYALRRRFAFVTLEPALDSPAFADWLKERNASDDMIALIRSRIGNLNAVIEKERDLGPGFRIGHSFFCPGPDDIPDEAWYREVIAGEIQPLLEEYFDARDRVEKLVTELLA